MTISLLVLFLAAGAPSGAEVTLVRVRSQLQAQVDELVNSPGLHGAKVGIHIERVEDGATLYDHGGDTLLVPASNVKIVTTSAALFHLSPDYRFHTDIYGDVSPGGAVTGDLIVKGYGDPWLVPERLWYLATRIYFRGVRKVQGDIVVDDSFFDGPMVANGSEQDDSSHAYMAPAGALSVGFNAVLVHVRPGPTAGSDAHIMLDPASAYAKVVGHVRTVSRGRTSVSVDVVPDGDRSDVKVSGRIVASEEGRGYWRRVDNPPIFAGEVFRSMLEQVGVKVKGKVRVGAVPDGAPLVVTMPSMRLAELVERVNKHSNNFMAAQIARTMGAEVYGAPGDWEKGRRAITSFLEQQIGLEPGSYTLNNASGLHDVNRFSPREIVRVLSYMVQQPRIGPEFVNSLAVAGGTGTLSERMGDSEAAHLLRAKTGTLSTASALSGYVTCRSGELIAFSFIVNDYQKGIQDVWVAQDALGDLLARTNFDEPASGRDAPVAAAGASP